MMSEPITMAQAQKSVRKILAKAAKKREEDESSLRERLVAIGWRKEMDKWSFMGDR